MNPAQTAGSSGKGIIGVYFILALIFCTVLRIVFIPFYPLILVVLFYAFRWKVKRNALIIFSILAVLWIFSFRNGVYLKYNLVSLYYYASLLLLFLASPVKTKNADRYLRHFMSALAIAAGLSDIFGIFQYIQSPNDDSFVGLYGRFTVSQNGLSLVNAVLFFYYLILFLNRRKSIYLLLAGFFIICFTFAFYGAGIIAIFAALALYFLKGKLKNIIVVFFMVTLVGVVAAFTIKILRPATFNYNVAIIKRFIDPSEATMPRKLIIVKNYVQNYPNAPLDFLFGSGPGTFNSRSAFMVGSPTYFNIDFLKSEKMPYYFKNFAYTLWNPSNITVYDGYMNQPFSSALALLGEYGLLFTLLIFVLVRQNYKYFSGLRFGQSEAQRYSIHKSMYRFCLLLAFTLIIIDNYVEYPETMVSLLFIAKICEQALKSRDLPNDSEEAAGASGEVN